MGGDRDYYRHILGIFETIGKFVIVFVRMILGKVEVDVFTGHHGKVTSDKKRISIS